MLSYDIKREKTLVDLFMHNQADIEREKSYQIIINRDSHPIV